MSGVGDYFHGEEGTATGLTWVTYDDDDTLSYILTLEGNPHRTKAQDYGFRSDIGIDPLIRQGDRVVYVRTDQTSGIWVKHENQFAPELERAIQRVLHNKKRHSGYHRLYGISPMLARLWARSLSYRTSIPLKFWSGEDGAMDRASAPMTEASVFLSHSGRNSVAARLLCEGLKEDGKVQVWFDLAHPGEAPNHEEHIALWLKEALFDCQVFAVLLTQASVASSWVQREIDWAMEKGRKDERFHLILLNLEGVAPPRVVIEARTMIDCEGLEFGEIKEELFAAVYQRTGRRRWVEEQKRRGWNFRGTQKCGYKHLMSDGGTAIALRWITDGDSFRWVLDFEAEPGIRKSAAGRGPWQVVDLDIRAGDRVGCASLGLWSPIWMRSNDLDVSMGDVVTKYQEKVGTPHKWFLTHSLGPPSDGP